MSEAIISVESLGKRYRIRHQQQGGMRYTALRDVLADTTKSVARRVWSVLRPPSFGASSVLRPPSSEDFWALRDVSFEVRQGETLGIIGRNGAGKSTLLKILSRITEPTEGRVRIKGRVASLLEVGTGFHPELTGRENIFLNGAILGMTRVEIKKKFDEIVAFAEIEEFLDTPVKRYSSGMYVRLAFAVAAHLEPEILIVDEVLAVGDAEFQKKCLGKMQNVASGGRTVILVSHNMATVGALCTRAIYLQKGGVILDGETHTVMNAYLSDKATQQGEAVWPDLDTAPGDERVRITAVRTLQDGQITSDVDMAKAVEVQVEYRVFTNGCSYGPSIHLLDRMGTCILATGNGPSATIGRDPWALKLQPPGSYCSSCFLPENFLNEGCYLLNAFVTDGAQAVAVALEVLGINAHDTGAMRGEYQGVWIGLLRPKLVWKTSALSQNVANPLN